MNKFYKNDNEQILEAERVYNKNYTLLIEEKDSYELPIDGWFYFESIELAAAEFGIELPIEKEEKDA